MNENLLVKKYVKRPVVIEAAEFIICPDPEQQREVAETIVNWVNSSRKDAPESEYNGLSIFIPTVLPIGQPRAHPGDFVVRRQNGDFCVRTPLLFTETYAPYEPEEGAYSD